jgi:2-polyprenyl-6-methoxyphenol hydroxylase-like FAD-dependent oxidoreductase
MGRTIGKQAIVVGAGIGGLAAAQALAGYFDRVIVIERDYLPEDAVSRTGTPQDRHPHGLLYGGQRALGKLFPGVEHDLVAAGGVLLPSHEFRYEIPGIPAMPQRDFGWSTCFMSRPLLELTLRRSLLRRDNVELRSGCRALALVPSPDRTALVGVLFETEEEGREALPADLVIDASGRGALSLALLKSIGHQLPDQTAVGVDLGYSTAIFAIPDDAPADWRAAATMAAAPKSSRAAYLFPIEGERWMVLVSGRGNDKPPGDWDGFMEYARHLTTPTIYNATKNAVRLGEIRRFAFTGSSWRHFERLDVLPRGLLPLGDSICRFNPVYGQGMSVAAKEARLLQQILQARAGKRDPLAGLGEAFLAGCEPLIEAPWTLSTIPDFVFPDTTGERPSDFDETLKFSAALFRTAHRDPNVHKTMTEVMHLVKPPSVYRDREFQQQIEAEIAEMADASQAEAAGDRPEGDGGNTALVVGISRHAGRRRLGLPRTI